MPDLLERLDWADEIVVVDGGSRDGTVRVARQFTKRVRVYRFCNFAEQRNRAVDHCRGEWVLFIDADERPGPGFAEEVGRRIGVPTRYVAFRVPIQSSIFGRRFRYSGTQDDRPIRLVRRDRARWQGAVHEVARVQGPVGRLDSGLLHETLPTLRAFLAKMDRYTSLEAQQRRKLQSRPWVFELVWRPPLEVFRRLVWKGGLLDGPAGWVFCVLSGVSTAVALLKSRTDEANGQALSRVLRRCGAWLDRLEHWVCMANGETQKVGCVPKRVGKGSEHFQLSTLNSQLSTPSPHASAAPREQKRKDRKELESREIENAVADRFDQLAGRFHERIEADDVRVRALLKHLGDVRGRRIVDLACGKGRYLRWLERAGARAVGVDLSRAMLSGHSGAGAVCCGRGVRLPFRDGTFDAACCIEGLSHFPDAAATLRELARVLRCGGRLVVIDKNAASLDARRPWLPGLAVKWLDEHRGRWMYPAGFVFCERWFLAARLVRTIEDEFREVASQYLLSPLEERSAGRRLFRRLPPVRHFMVITGVKR